MATAASKFLQSLSATQKSKARFSLEDEERFHWNYVPLDRKGIPLLDLNAAQNKAAMDLLNTVLSDAAFKKTNAIIKLEDVLREIESASIDYRNPGKYYFSIFGTPAKDSIWGWRLEGHHVSLNFSSENNELTSATPGFMGANPAVVPSGAQKGLQILKDETEAGFALLNSLSAQQKEKTIFNTRAPNDIVTGSSRKAMINDPKGILYSELTPDQQKIFLQHVLHIARECLLINYGDRSMIRFAPAELETFRKFAPFVNRNNADDFVEEINKAHYHLERNANSKILFTDLSFSMYRILQVK